MLGLLRHKSNFTPELLASRLYNDQTFYRAFEKDLANCRDEVIIESPFITSRRVRLLLPIHMRPGAGIEPMSGQTIVLPPEEANAEVGEAVVKSSRGMYATACVKPIDSKKPKERPGKDKGSDGKKGKGDGKDGDSTNALESNDDR